jgi:hypothetical protein
LKNKYRTKWALWEIDVAFEEKIQFSEGGEVWILNGKKCHLLA